MSSKWFSNRGQIIQVVCAILAAAVAIYTQWSNLTAAIDLETILKILFFPVAAVVVFQLGKYVGRRSAPSSPVSAVSPFEYRYLSLTIKVGSYSEFDEKLDVRRISVISIKEEELLSSVKAGAEIEVTGTGVYFSGGEQTT